MAWNLFDTTNNYSVMLTKIALFSTAVAFVLVTLLRARYVEFDNVLRPLDAFRIEVAKGLNLALGSLAPAVLVGLVSRVAKLHDRLSDLFGIRARFDVEAILLPLASGSGGLQNVEHVRRLYKERDRIMRETFYAYASSTKGRAKIDEHYITMALDMWCWYWIVLEAAAQFAVVGVIFLMTSDWGLALIACLAIFVAQVMMLLIRAQCRSYALTEVALILAEPSRKHAVGEVFGAL